MTRQGRAWLRETNWSYLLGIAYFLMALTALATIGAERGGMRRQLGNLLLSAALGLLVAKLMVNGYGGLLRYREATRDGASWMDRLSALLPRLVVAQSRMDSAHISAVGAWLLRRPLAPLAPGRRFGFLKRSSYSTLIILGLIGTFVDLPLSTMLASLVSKDPAMQMRIHIVMGMLALYSLIWLMGDRRLMQGSAHVLDETSLQLSIAGRLAARIPLQNLVRGEAVTVTANEWCKRHGVPVHTALFVRPSPFDRPNLALFLDDGTGAQFTEWQLPGAMPKVLLLYVDEPAQLLAALFPVQSKD